MSMHDARILIGISFLGLAVMPFVEMVQIPVAASLASYVLAVLRGIPRVALVNGLIAAGYLVGRGLL
jgi:hypothetical protein